MYKNGLNVYCHYKNLDLSVAQILLNVKKNTFLINIMSKFEHDIKINNIYFQLFLQFTVIFLKHLKMYIQGNEVI